MMTRRQAIGLLGACAAQGTAARMLAVPKAGTPDLSPPLAAGLPNSPERTALIDAFRKKSEGLEQKFEARSHKSSAAMPYRLFRPAAKSKLPLVVYLHGSGGLGDDNRKQLGLGNIFGTRVWLLPENQERFPCYVLAPQTDSGWARYDMTQEGPGPANVLPGPGDGSRLALEIIDSLRREFPIDDRRIYLTGQSMGGAGVWNMLAGRPKLFAAAIPCCGSRSTETGAESIETPMWAFHGDADQTVPVDTSRERMAARRKAGGTPIYSEYPGVDHNVWQWAYTEPELVKWMFAQRLK